MWSLSAWRRRRTLAKHPIADDMWQRVRHHLSFLDGLSAAEDRWLREASVLFLQDKHLTALPGVVGAPWPNTRLPTTCGSGCVIT